jgi:hypothetical protein
MVVGYMIIRNPYPWIFFVRDSRQLPAALHERSRQRSALRRLADPLRFGRVVQPLGVTSPAPASRYTSTRSIASATPAALRPSVRAMMSVSALFRTTRAARTLLVISLIKTAARWTNCPFVIGGRRDIPTRFAKCWP